MARIDRVFTGGLNLDDDKYRLPPNDFIDALNITRDNRGEAQDKVVTNINGNTQISYTLPAGTNKAIGQYGDRVRNRLYYFVYNSNGNHSILYYDGVNDNIVKVFISKTDSGGDDILEFTNSERITSVNVLHRETGDLLYFIDSLGRPSQINVVRFRDGLYTNIVRSYIDVIKAPPQMPVKCVYEKDDDVSVNNLNGKLFKFKYRYIYDTDEKSVWSSASKVPLPYQPFDQDITTDKSYNARINTYFSTGDETVTAIELAVSQNLAAGASDYQLVTSLNKTDLSIADNVISNYQFYNDSVYPAIDIREVQLRQDYVPQEANAQELLNGNTLIYGGITEGYDLIAGSFTGTSGIDSKVDDICGMLFFASQDDTDSYGTSSELKIRLRGTGSNTSGNPTTILNANGATFYIQAVLANGTDVSFQYTSATTSVATILAGLLAAAVLKGFTGSVSGTTLTITQSTVVLRTSYYIQDLSNLSANYQNNVYYSLLPQCNYSYGVVYEDAYGRTNSVITTADLNINTLALDETSLIKYPYVTLAINNRPPIWAKCWRPVRTPELNYDKQLFWVSRQAFSNKDANYTPPNPIAYIDISNMEYYNQQIQSTSGHVSYEFQQGDRIKFLARYPVSGSTVQLSSNLDFEIVGVQNEFNLNGVQKNGRFIKIMYPTGQISPDFKFDGADDFQNYKIFIYSPRKSTANTQNFYYEFGERYPIGNPYTANAYHIGNRVTQTEDLGTPASSTFYYGDEFLRYRITPSGNTYEYPANDSSGFDSYTSLEITVDTTVSTSLYTIETQARQPVDNTIGGYPLAASADWFFKNESASETITLRLTGVLPIYDDSSGDNAFSMYYIITNAPIPYATKYFGKIIQNTPVKLNVTTFVPFDFTLPIPAGAKLWLATNPEGVTAFNSLKITSFNLKVDVVRNTTCEIVDTSFSDVLDININSNDSLRPDVIEINAKNQYYPTTVRHGQSYQKFTSVNNINRFYPEDLDDYDRSYSDIVRLHVRERYLKVYQRFKVGNVPILTQIIQDTAGNPFQAQTDKLINKIQYYQGEYGIGYSPASLAWNNYADYFVDDVRGVVCRLSQDGVTPISLLYKTNAFFTDKLQYFRPDLNTRIVPVGEEYPGDPAVIGAFDPYTNKYILALEEINRYTETVPPVLYFHQDAYTISFNEATNTFESLYSYKPELMGILNTMFFSFKDGGIWVHNSNTYCNFYGVQYPCSITLVFNDSVIFKKTFLAIMETGNITWICPSISTNMPSYGSTLQTSELKLVDFKTLEGTYNATFLRDSNSIGGILNGKTLKGEYIVVKLQVDSTYTDNLVSLNTVSVKYIDSPMNLK